MNERTLFLAALDVAAADRAAYLDRACGADADLRRRVEGLLAAHTAAGSFMNRPAAERGEDVATLAHEGVEQAGPAGLDSPPVEALLAGRYELVREIGRGGMGTVYLARQVQPVKRSVAVKLIRLGLDSRTILARFEAERQALAIMDHPNIAKVLDAGTTADGRPFFVMELVEGTPLTEYCDAHRLPVAERLILFRAICQAVQHAHQKGVIHRDLKPGNVLVETREGAAVPKVIDFGLAKAIGEVALTEETLFSAPGSAAGTPLYMAPEQTDGRPDVDTRADVYSLGAVLYELLTGTTPIRRETFKRAALHEVLRVIREDEPPAPSSRLGASDSAPSVAANRAIEPARLGRLVRGDLDWVVMKALEKDRGRRYESAAAFAADVDRFLHHEPVSAGPPTRAYRLRKFVRRHRAAVLAAGLVFALLVAGIVGTTWGLVRARAEQTKAEQAAERSTQALATLSDDVLKDFLGRRATWGDPEREFLQRVRVQFESLAAADGNSPDARRGRAAAQSRLGLVQALLGDAAGAEADFRASIAGFEAFDDEVSRREAANARRMLGSVFADSGRIPEALAELQTAREAFERLAAEFPTDPRHPYNAALAWNDGGVANLRANRLADAADSFRAAAQAFAALSEAAPTNSEYLMERGRALANLTLALNRLNRPKEAEAAVREAIPLLRQASALRRDRSIQLELSRTLATAGVLAGNERPAAAEPFLRESLAVAARLAADYPSVPDIKNELALGHTALAILFALTDRVSEAEGAYREAITITQRLVDAFPAAPEYRQRLANNRISLAVILLDTNRGPQAEALLADSLPLWEKLHADQPAVPVYLVGLVKTLALSGQAAEKRKDYPRAKSFLERADAKRNTAPEQVGRDVEGVVAVWLLEKFLTRTLLGQADHAAAAVRADRLAALTAPDPGVNAYDGCCYLSRCSALAAKDEKLPPDARKKLAEEYALRAVAHLRTATKRGFVDKKVFASDTDLVPLRERADYKALLAELK